jgi:hypothetical protein
MPISPLKSRSQAEKLALFLALLENYQLLTAAIPRLKDY